MGVLCTLYIVQCTMYSVQSTMYTCISYSVDIPNTSQQVIPVGFLSRGQK